MPRMIGDKSEDQVIKEYRDIYTHFDTMLGSLEALKKVVTRTLKTQTFDQKSRDAFGKAWNDDLMPGLTKARILCKKVGIHLK